jgi:hypothetical protein
MENRHIQNRKIITEKECLDIMDKFLDSQDDPKLGIFWYDPRDQELFGVSKSYRDEVKGTTIKTLHKTVWAKEFNKRKNKGLPPGKWAGSYTDIPRGRIFYINNEFVVKTGSWISDYPEAKQLIIEEFDLPENVKFEKEIHWEIGQGYEH